MDKGELANYDEWLSNDFSSRKVSLYNPLMLTFPATANRGFQW